MTKSEIGLNKENNVKKIYDLLWSGLPITTGNFRHNIETDIIQEGDEDTDVTILRFYIWSECFESTQIVYDNEENNSYVLYTFENVTDPDDKKNVDDNIIKRVLAEIMVAGNKITEKKIE